MTGSFEPAMLTRAWVDFTRCLMKDPETGEYRDITWVPGIGPKAAKALEAIGVTKAYHLLVWCRVYLSHAFLSLGRAV